MGERKEGTKERKERWEGKEGRRNYREEGNIKDS